MFILCFFLSKSGLSINPDFSDINNLNLSIKKIIKKQNIKNKICVINFLVLNWLIS